MIGATPTSCVCNLRQHGTFQDMVQLGSHLVNDADCEVESGVNGTRNVTDPFNQWDTTHGVVRECVSSGADARCR